jgi:hypothetical protein
MEWLESCSKRLGCIPKAGSPHVWGLRKTEAGERLAAPRRTEDGKVFKLEQIVSMADS